MTKKVTKHAAKMALVYPFIKQAKIYRLSIKQSVELLEEHNIDISERQYKRWKKEFEENIHPKFLKIARVDYGDEHINLLETLKETQKMYWEQFKKYEKTEPVAALKALDGVRSATRDIVMMYDLIPIVQEVRNSIDKELEGVTPKEEEDLLEAI